MQARALVLLLLGSLALVSSPATRADDGGNGDAWQFKLTPSLYRTTDMGDAVDINLRANRGSHALWIADYRRNSEYEQTRAGYEYTWDFGWGQLVPSLQIASHGFFGGSLTFQGNGVISPIVGLGRTNTRDYYNLNFDPNDAVTVGLGTTLLPHSTLSLFSVRDDRLGTGQTTTHLVWRWKPEDRHRWTADLSRKRGRPSATDDMLYGEAFALTYDFDDWFLRLARDRKVNFTPADQTRLSLGYRF